MLDLQFWVALGLLLVLADIFLGFSLFVLPVGVAALIVAGIIFVQTNAVMGITQLYDDWQGLVYWFAGLSVVSVGLLRLIFQRQGKTPRTSINIIVVYSWQATAKGFSLAIHLCFPTLSANRWKH